VDASIALCALPLAVGILGTLAAMGIFGRKLPGDRSNEVAELHTLLSRREQELERLEAAAEAAAGQSQALQAENAHLAEQRERLTAAHADAERRAADVARTKRTSKGSAGATGSSA